MTSFYHYPEKNICKNVAIIEHYGDYWTYIEDIEAGEISLTETVTVLIRVLSQWKSDLHSRKNPLYAKMTTYQLVLAAMA